MSPPSAVATRPRLARRLVKGTHDLMFRRVHGGRLIYNACWEDPRLDRELLDLRPDSRVVMITSAGCNALEYLLDDPREIHAVDMNFRQNALLELKSAVLQACRFSDVFELFGIGSHDRFRAIYRGLREGLSPAARGFWNRNITFFDPVSLRRSFYYQGAAGAAAWLLGGTLFRAQPNIKNFALALLDAQTLAEQREIFAILEPKIWSPLNNWLIRQPALMTLLGVPGPQIKLIEGGYPGGLTAYIKDKLRHVLTELPAHENYFWRVYITGSYTLGCCPAYLRREHQSVLQARRGRIRTHTDTLSGFLRRHPGAYSHFVLLDHQDWLAWHAPAALAEEWDLILRNSRPGTRILLRSAALEVDFIPDAARERLRFFPERTGPLHGRDRVGTYGCQVLAEVR